MAVFRRTSLFRSQEAFAIAGEDLTSKYLIPLLPAFTLDLRISGEGTPYSLLLFSCQQSATKIPASLLYSTQFIVYTVVIKGITSSKVCATFGAQALGFRFAGSESTLCHVSRSRRTNIRTGYIELSLIMV